MKNERVKEKGSCRTVCILCLSPMFIAAILVVAWRPILLPYSVKYVQLAVSHIVHDKQRFFDNELLFAHKEWKFYQMETRLGQDWCKEHGKSRSNVTWLTVMVGDEYITPALTLPAKHDCVYFEIRERGNATCTSECRLGHSFG